MTRKLKIYFLISIILFLIFYVWISIEYMVKGSSYFPSIEMQIFFLIITINIFLIAIWKLIRNLNK